MTTQPKLPKKGQKLPGGKPFVGGKEPKRNRSKTQHGGVHDTQRRATRGGK
jgi:hypothetical protein